MLGQIQKELKAPKSQFNSFGKYKYRSCEDILKAVKDILPDNWYLVLNDSIELVGDRIYVRANASLYEDGSLRASANGYARESATKKGMDDAQITGSTSSYARKYALNGLFAIDDTKDADTDEIKNQVDNTPKPNLVKDSEEWVRAVEWVKGQDWKTAIKSISAKYDFDLDAFREAVDVQD